MRVRVSSQAAEETGADAVAIGLFEGEGIPDGPAAPALRALLESGEGRTALRKVAHTHHEGRRWLLVGLGAREAFEAEGARVAAAAAHGRAREAGARALCWVPPAGAGAAETAGLVEGTVLAGYRFERYRRRRDGGEGGRHGVEELVISGAGEQLEAAVSAAATVAEAQNRARDLQNTPANDLTPTRLADRAQRLAAELDGLSVEVEDREGILARRMGAFAAVARAAREEPRLVTMRYAGPGAEGPTLGYVGKAVTFDAGGISLKPAAKMHEMKFDMSGGAAVIEAIGAIARLRLPVTILGVVGATENMPGGDAIHPGDIVTAMSGTTIEVNNTDAEGRLVLADCLSYAIEQGAERVVDVATLTGAIVTALGSTMAGLMSNDDAWARQLEEAAHTSGELLWRLPLHPEYDEMIKGQYADIVNATDVRKAMSITSAQFLRRFVGDVPWAHLDIAGTAWGLGRPYAGKGGSGFGVRLLVELARSAR
jgi:leucyl aminopeptidase